tara:strand:- start:155 stop:292 length:138 start_codon:yes stop_codon:yes gene_type:complete
MAGRVSGMESQERGLCPRPKAEKLFVRSATKWQCAERDIDKGSTN